MPIIKPRGLLGGERLGKLSDEARLYWPFMYAGSNGYGRFEVSYLKIVQNCFPQFQVKPPQETIKRILHEYHAQNLLYVYDASGVLWAAWDSAAKQDYYSSDDKRSPAPPEPEFSNWKQTYRDRRDRENQTAPDGLAETFRQKIQDSAENSTFGQKNENSGRISEVQGRKLEILPTPPLVLTSTSKTSEHQETLTSTNGIVVELRKPVRSAADSFYGQVAVNGFTHTTIPSDPAFEVWATAAWIIHPKKKRKSDAWLALAAVFRAPEKKRLFDKNHPLWCETKNWRKEEGSYCPLMHEFIADEGYLCGPLSVSENDLNDGYYEIPEL